MAELQTLSAVGELAKLARDGFIFLKKVKNADKTIIEVCDRIGRLQDVLDGIQSLLTSRGTRFVAPEELLSMKRIEVAVSACLRIVESIQSRVGGFSRSENRGSGTQHGSNEDQEKAKITLLNRVTVVLREPGTRSRQAELDARISTLQVELTMLQIWEQRRHSHTMGSNHQEILSAIGVLGRLVNEGKQLSLRMLEDRDRNSGEGMVGPADADDDQDALINFHYSHRIASEVHEKLSAEYQPDDVSVRMRAEASSSRAFSPAGQPMFSSRRPSGVQRSGIATPMTIMSSESLEVEDEIELPHPELIERHISGYLHRSRRESEQGHFKRAAVSLQNAIQYSEVRERHHGVPFRDRQELNEELATLYLEQGKHLEAVRIVKDLLREGGDENAVARQHELLATIYKSRSGSLPDQPTHVAANDIKKAETHGLKAFSKRFEMMERIQPADHDIEAWNRCVELLVRIFEAQHKEVEANDYRAYHRMRDGSFSDSAGRISAQSDARPVIDDFVHVNTHQSLIEAIKCSDLTRVQTILSDEDVDIDQTCADDKTPLIYAVEYSGVDTLRRLLDADNGGNVNGKTSRGLTALHRAAELGSVEMIHCLLENDAEKEMMDDQGETALMKAVQKDQRTVIRHLSQEGADMLTKDSNEWSLLHHSIRLSGVETTKLLLELCPDLGSAIDTKAMTALHYAAEMCFIEQAEALLTHSNSVDVNAIDTVQRYPLYFATSHPPTPQRERMVRLLRRHGARLDPSRLPPRYEDYGLSVPKKNPKKSLTRHDSVSTDGSIGTTSTGTSRLSRLFSSRMQHK